MYRVECEKPLDLNENVLSIVIQWRGCWCLSANLFDGQLNFGQPVFGIFLIPDTIDIALPVEIGYLIAIFCGIATDMIEYCIVPCYNRFTVK